MFERHIPVRGGDAEPDPLVYEVLGPFCPGERLEETDPDRWLCRNPGWKVMNLPTKECEVTMKLL